jgi:two-component system LytT family response regulator
VLLLHVDRDVTRRLRELARRGALRSLRGVVTLLADDPALSPATAAEARPVPTPRRHRTRFLVRVGARARVVDVRDVSWIRSTGYYVTLVARNRKEHVVRASLDRLERQLDPGEFLRIHRSAIVRLGDVGGVERSATGSLALILQDGTRLPISRGRREVVLRELGAA